MSPETSGILIGAASLALATLLTWIGIHLGRLWHTPKRLDRIEGIIPVLTRGMWAILKVHINGNTDKDVASAFDELTKAVTNGVVSQKEKK